MATTNTPSDDRYIDIPKRFSPEKSRDIKELLKVWETSFMIWIDKSHFEKNWFLNETFFQFLIDFLNKNYTDDALKKDIYERVMDFNKTFKNGHPLHAIFFKNMFPSVIEKALTPHFEEQQLNASFQEWFYPLAYTPTKDGYSMYYLTIDWQYEWWLNSSGDIQWNKSCIKWFDIKYAIEETQTVIKGGGIHHFDLDSNPNLRIVPAEKMKHLLNIQMAHEFIWEMDKYIQTHQDDYAKRVDEIITNGMKTL